MTTITYSSVLPHAAAPSPLKTIDWPDGLPVVGPLFDIRRDQLGSFERMAEAADAIRFRVVNKRIHLLTHPDHVRHVLVDAAKSYGKQTRGYRAMRAVVGQGLLTSEGDFWLRQRRLAQPAFHRKKIETFAKTFVDVAADTAAEWREPATRDVARDMMRLTLRIVALTLLSRDAAQDADEIGDALTVGLEHIIHKMNTPWAPPDSWPTPANRRFRAAVARIDRLVSDVIAERRARGPASEADGGDLLDLLMMGRDEKDGMMSDAQLRDEVMTILLAGHETTAMALSWTLWLLARHPAIESALRAEIAAAVGDRPATLADLPKLALAERVLNESMRLYPPAWVVARSADEADDCCGDEVRPGDWIFLSPWLTHRRADFWPDPLRFDPDRFLPEAVAARHRYAFIPFSTGQRKCIGDQFALLEARLVLVTLLQRARFTLAPGHERVEPEPLVTLRPKGGLTMRVEPIR